MTSPDAIVRALTLFTLGGVLALAAPGSRARACSGPTCPMGEVFPSGGDVPANQIAIRWSKPRSGRDLALAPDSSGSLKRVEAGQLVVVPVTNTSPEPSSYLANLVPAAAIPVGTVLDFSYSWACGDETALLHSRLMVTAAAPLPSSLGKLSSTVQRGTITRAGGSACVETRDTVYADLTVTLASDAEPFRDVIRYGLEVDGQPFSTYIEGDPSLPHAEYKTLGGSTLGRGKDRIYAGCDTPWLASVTPGAHRVRMIGLLPDGSAIASDEVELALLCDAPRDGGAAGATRADGGVGSSASFAGRGSVDAALDGAAQGEEIASDVRRAESDGGCSLTHGEGRRGVLPGLTSALLAVACLSGRRRTSRAR